MQHVLENIQTIIQNNHSLAFLAVFAGGLISAASPCVLAAIPLIIGYVGGYSGGDKKKAAIYSLVFILGLSITFTVLGAAASAMGRFLSFAGQWLYVGLAVVAVAMGFQLMGLITIPLPFRKTHQVKSRGLWGAFLLGLLTGTVSSPCATPVLAVILAYVSTQGDILYGGSLLFAYAVGPLRVDLRRRSFHRADGEHRAVRRVLRTFPCTRSGSAAPCSLQQGSILV